MKPDERPGTFSVSLHWESFLLFGLIYLLPTSILCQSDLDSLIADHSYKVEELQDEQAQIDLCLYEIKQYKDRNPEFAEYLIRKIIPLCVLEGEQLKQAQCLYWKAYILARQHTVRQNMAFAGSSLFQCKALLEQINNTQWLGKVLVLDAYIHFFQEKPEEARLLAGRAFKHLNDHPYAMEDSLEVLAGVHCVRAGIAFLDEDLWAVKTNLLDAIELYKQLNDVYNVAYNAAAYTRFAADEAEAKHFIQLALNIYEENDDHLWKARSWAKLGEYYFDRTWEPDWFEKCVRSYRRAMQIWPKAEANTYYLMGRAFHQKAHHLDSLGFLTEVIPYADSASKYYFMGIYRAGLENNKRIMDPITKDVAEVCRLVGNCDVALANTTRTFLTVVDSTHHVAHSAQEEKDQFILAGAKADAEARRRFLVWSGIFLFTISALVVIALFYRWRLRQLRQTLESRLEALRAQMNPHFISNIINSIDYLINKGKRKEASYYLIQFSRLCRLILNHSREKFISLSEEVDMLTHYLRLEKLRMEDRLTFDITIDKSINSSTIPVPPMMLNPFVENAIIHGIQKKQAPGHLSVKIQPGSEADKVICIIEDNGVGRKKAAEMERNSILHRSSVGMALTQERIENLPGASIRIVDLEDDNGRAKGTRVVIVLSKKQKSDAFNKSDSGRGYAQRNGKYPTKNRRELPVH